MIDRKMAVIAAALFLATIAASTWSLIHAFQIDPETLTMKRIVFGHLIRPAVDIGMLILIRRSARRFPYSQSLEPPLQKHFGFMLVSVYAVTALQQIMLLARQLNVQVSLHNLVILPTALMGVFLVVVGNGLGKLPSPYKEGGAEPFSWDKMNRFSGWVFVILGLGLVVGSLTLPRSTIFPSLVVSWVICMSLILAKRHRLKQNMRDGMH